MGKIINPEDIVIPREIKDKWQNIVNILIKVMKVPVALIMRLEYPSFTVFESAQSPENPFKENDEFKLPAGIYCEKTMRTREKNLVPNALNDPEWDKNPSIQTGLISYIGLPILYPDKNVFGTLCVLDKKENFYSNDFEEIMSQFKEIIESHLELLWQKMLLQDMVAQLRITEKQLKEKIEAIEGINKVCVNREIEILELKKKISALEKKTSQTGKE